MKGQSTRRVVAAGRFVEECDLAGDLMSGHPVRTWLFECGGELLGGVKTGQGIYRLCSEAVVECEEHSRK